MEMGSEGSLDLDCAWGAQEKTLGILEVDSLISVDGYLPSVFSFSVLQLVSWSAV